MMLLHEIEYPLMYLHVENQYNREQIFEWIVT